MKIVSVNIGQRRKIVWKNKTVETGIFKIPVDKPIYLGEEDVANDNVVDRKYHGGIDQAVYGYSADHYDFFKTLHPDLEWNFGMFGENITFDDLNEELITVGSQYKLGECLIEVTKPREPCYKLGVRFGTQKIVKQFWNSSKSGIYFKVIQTGFVRVGDQMELIHKPLKAQTIAAVYDSKK